MNRHGRLAQAVVTIAVTLLVGCYYWWAVRAAGDRIEWNGDLRGYYNYLGQAFASGHLHLPITPSSELLALKDPWDPKQNDPYRMHDMVLFGGKYYLYHGAGPAVLLFAPWRRITGHDLPENVAVAVFCIGGFLFYSAALMRVLDDCGNPAGPGLRAFLLLTLGVGQSVPYLCSRVGVYEVAIAGGFCSVAAGIYFLSRGLTASRPASSLAAAGLMFGLALACRPHLGFVGFICFAALVIYIALKRGERIRWRDAAWYLVAFTASGLMVAVYNYVRFGDPFEFGLRYLLAGDEAQQRVRLSGCQSHPRAVLHADLPTGLQPRISMGTSCAAIAFRCESLSPTSRLFPGASRGRVVRCSRTGCYRVPCVSEPAPQESVVDRRAVQRGHLALCRNDRIYYATIPGGFCPAGRICRFDQGVVPARAQTHESGHAGIDGLGRYRESGTRDHRTI